MNAHLPARFVRSVGLLPLVVSCAVIVVGGRASAGAAVSDPNAADGAIGSARDSVGKIFSRSDSGVGEGSGFVVATDRVLTNAHVLQGESDATVRFPGGRTESCTVVSVSTAVDLATLRCSTGERRVLALAKSARNGESVAAIGYPNAGAERVTHGAVTAASPNPAGYLTTDAALDPGNSGGPIVAVDSGEVVGIATAIDREDRATNFAIPASTVSRYLADASTSVPGAVRSNGDTSPAWWALAGAVVIGFAAGFFVRGIRGKRRRSGGRIDPDDGEDLKIAIRDPAPDVGDARSVADLPIALVGAPRQWTESVEPDDDTVLEQKQ